MIQDAHYYDMKLCRHEFSLTGLKVGDEFLGCIHCWFRHDPGTITRPDCPQCDCRMNIFTVKPEDLEDSLEK